MQDASATDRGKRDNKIGLHKGAVLTFMMSYKNIHHRSWTHSTLHSLRNVYYAIHKAKNIFML